MENTPNPLSLNASKAIRDLELKCHSINPPHHPKIEVIPLDDVGSQKKVKKASNKDLKQEQPISRAYLAGIDATKASFTKGLVFKDSCLRGAVLPENLQSGHSQARLEGCDLIDTETVPSASLVKKRNLLSRGSPHSVLIRPQRPFFNVSDASVLHSGWTALAVFPNGHLACAQGHTIWIYDPRTRRVQRIIPGDRKVIFNLTVINDHLLASVGFYSKSITIWDIDSGRKLHSLEGHQRRIVSLTGLGNGLLASGSDDRTIQIWEAASGELIRTLEGHRNGVCSLASLSPELLASGSEDKSIGIWEINTGKRLHSLEGHRWPVTGLAVLEDGRLASAGSYDKTVRIWEVETGEHLDTLQIRQAVIDLTSLGNGLLALKTGGKGLSIWEVDSGQSVHRLEGHTQTIHAVVALNPTDADPSGMEESGAADDSKSFLVSGSEDHTLRIWDADTGKTVHILESYRESFWNTTSLENAAHHIAVDGKDNSVRLIDTETGKLLQVFKGHQKPVRGLTSLGKDWIASASFDKTIRIWDAKTGRQIQVLEGHEEPVWSLVGLNKGLIASGSKDKTVRIWEAKSGKLLHTLKGHKGTVWSLAALGNGLLASSSNDKTIRIWEAESGNLLHILRGHQASVRSLAATEDGLLVSGSNDKNVHIWEVESGKLLHILKGHRDLVCNVAVAKNGYIASGSEDTTICIWKVGNPKPIHILNGHQDTVKSLTSISSEPGKAYFASASEDGTIRTWDAVSGRCLSLCYPLCDTVMATVIFEARNNRGKDKKFEGITLSRIDRPWNTTLVRKKVLPADAELDAFCGFLNEKGHRMSIYDYPKEYGKVWYWDDPEKPHTLYLPWPKEASHRKQALRHYRKLFNAPDPEQEHDEI